MSGGGYTTSHMQWQGHGWRWLHYQPHAVAGVIGGGTGSVINRVPDSLGPCSGHSEEAIVLLCLCYTYSQLIKTTDKSVEDKWPCS